MDQKTWMLNTVLVVGFIQKVLGLDKSNCGDLFSEESIHRAIGVLRTNSVKLDDPPGMLREHPVLRNRKKGGGVRK